MLSRFGLGLGGVTLRDGVGAPAIDIDFTTGLLDPRISYTHTNSNTWGFNAAGLLTQYAATSPRFDYGAMGGGACRGLRIDGTDTNQLFPARDGTDANWTKSASMTVAKDVTGLDGVANSATRLTAGAADQTILRAITLASAERCFSIYLKRVTGTGTVEITDDGGVNWIDVTAALAAGGAGWSRHYNFRTQANPSVGVRIRTSGDEVAFDCAQVEDNNYPSTPIITTTATVQRVRSDAIISGTNFSGWFSALEGTFLVEFYLDYMEATDTHYRRALFQLDDTTQNERMTGYAVETGFSQAAGPTVVDGGVTQAAINIGAKCAAVTKQKFAFSYKANDIGAALNGAAGTRDMAATLPTVTRLVVGGRVGSSEHLNGVISRIRYWPQVRTNSQLQALSS